MNLAQFGRLNVCFYLLFWKGSIGRACLNCDFDVVLVQDAVDEGEEADGEEDEDAKGSPKWVTFTDALCGHLDQHVYSSALNIFSILCNFVSSEKSCKFQQWWVGDWQRNLDIQGKSFSFGLFLSDHLSKIFWFVHDGYFCYQIRY